MERVNSVTFDLSSLPDSSDTAARTLMATTATIAATSIASAMNNLDRPLLGCVMRQSPGPRGLSNEDVNAARSGTPAFWLAFGLTLEHLQRGGVDAEPETGRRRPVGENVPEVRIADAAHRFDARHPVRVIGLVLDDVRRNRL